MSPQMPPAPQAPPPPPNPPMFGSNQTGAAGTRQRSMAAAAGGFGGTLLGSGNPTNTGQKTLLGQ